MGGLAALRLIFLAIVGSELLILAVMPSVLPGGGSVSPIYLGVMLFFGLYGIGAVVWFRSRRLDFSSPSSLVESYRSTFFIGIGMALGTGAMGLALSFVDETSLPYLIGVIFTLVGLVLIAPTRTNLNRRQQQITASGSALSLVEALMASPPRRRSGR